jgi:hypothetical protein
VIKGSALREDYDLSLLNAAVNSLRTVPKELLQGIREEQLK